MVAVLADEEVRVERAVGTSSGEGGGFNDLLNVFQVKNDEVASDSRGVVSDVAGIRDTADGEVSEVGNDLRLIRFVIGHKKRQIAEEFDEVVCLVFIGAVISDPRKGIDHGEAAVGGEGVSG